jgi:glycerol kinase
MTSCCACSMPRDAAGGAIVERGVWETNPALRRSVPIAGNAGDQQAALFGQAC